MKVTWTRMKYLGFEPFETARVKRRAKDQSTYTFQASLVNCYTWWQRFRLGLLLMAGVDLSTLHVPLRKGGNIGEVQAWVESVREKPELHKTVCDALRTASEAFGKDDD